MKNHSVPKLPLIIFKWFCRQSYHADIEGDLIETYDRNLIDVGRRKAYWRLMGDVVRLFRPGIIKPLNLNMRKNYQPMLKNSILTTVRNLMRNKVSSVLNISGLSIGMVACIFIMLYVNKQIRYDQNLPDNVYRITNEKYASGELVYAKAITYPSVAPLLKDISPEVVDYTRFWKLNGDVVFSANRKELNIKKMMFADNSVFKMFSIPVINGNAEAALTTPASIAISATTAKAFFDTEDPLNKSMTMISGSDRLEGVVTAVFEDLPDNTHLDFTVLVSFSTAEGFLGGQQEVLNNWKLARFYNYVQLSSADAVQTINNRLGELVAKHKPDETSGSEKLLLQPAKDIHLHSSLLEEMKPNGNITIVYFFSAIAVFILFLAYLNYINLSTAQAMTRAKEVGIRKVMGAVRSQLSRQFLIESLLVNTIAIAIAVIVVVAAQSYFAQFIGDDSSVFGQKTLMLVILLVLLTGAFLSGLYPAFVLSAFNPVSILKGKLVNSRGGTMLRKTLVVFQYTISTVLAIGTFIIYSQVDFMLNRDLGMNIDRTLVLKAPSAIAEDSVSANKFVFFKEEVLRNPSVQSFTASTEIPGKEIGQLNEGQVRLVGSDVKDARNYYLMGIDSTFFRVFEMQILNGRDLTGDVNFYENVVINRAAARQLGFEDPEDAIGVMINCFGVNRIIGVVENYNQQSLKNSYSPIIFYLRNPKMLYSYYVVKLNTADISSSLISIEDAWKESFAGNPFEYFFLDDFFNEQYRGDKQFRTMFTTFSILALLIASLGLFGLSSYTLMQQLKEIGIRKVLGAKAISLFGTLSFDFLKLVSLSNLIALPLSYLIAQQWLSNFAFRIDNQWWLYVVPCVTTVLLSLVVVSYHVVKGSLTNPIKVIREN